MRNERVPGGMSVNCCCVCGGYLSSESLLAFRMASAQSAEHEATRCLYLSRILSHTLVVVCLCLLLSLSLALVVSVSHSFLFPQSFSFSHVFSLVVRVPLLTLVLYNPHQ